jgi:hypothetical protein
MPVNEAVKAAFFVVTGIIIGGVGYFTAGSWLSGTFVLNSVMYLVICGAAGGFIHTILNNSGEFTGPGFGWDPFKIKFGSFSDIILGIAAAFVTYAVNPPSTQLQLVFLAFTSGIGASAILNAYTTAQALNKQKAKTEGKVESIEVLLADQVSRGTINSDPIIKLLEQMRTG